MLKPATSVEEPKILVNDISKPSTSEEPLTSVIESLIQFNQETTSDEHSSLSVMQSPETTPITTSPITSSSPQSASSSFGPSDVCF